MRAFVAILASASLVGACQKASNDDKKDTPKSSGSAGSIAPMGKATPAKPDQIAPPLDLKTPPADATKTASGLVLKKLTTNDAGTAPKRNDTVLINFTGWKQASGETFYSNASKGAPMPLPLANAAPGFTEALQLMKTGEKAMLWVPPDIGYRGAPQGKPELLVYAVELVKIDPAPEMPADYAAPPAGALVIKPTDIKYEVVRPGTGDKARNFDTVTFNYTAWDKTGRMFDSTEVRKRPASAPPYRQSPAMESVLTSIAPGERIRFWADAEQMLLPGQKNPSSPTGQVCYELEILQVAKAAGTPPPAPPDVAKPPDDAKKTEKGVFYKVLKTGKGGPKPTTKDSVSANYTGWTTNGRMFDSSALKGKPLDFNLSGGVIAGWLDGVPLMSVGDTYRFWIPDTLAYKGAPEKPQGMLVFDIELVSIKPPASPDAPPSGPPGANPHAPHGGPHGAPPPQ